MWKRMAVLVEIILLPVSAVAHTKLFCRMSYRSDYRKVEIVEPMVTPFPEPTFMPEPTEVPLVEIPLKSTLSPEPILTPIPTETPTEVPTSTPEEVELPDQISTPSDVDDQVDIATL